MFRVHVRSHCWRTWSRLRRWPRWKACQMSRAKMPARLHDSLANSKDFGRLRQVKSFSYLLQTVFSWNPLLSRFTCEPIIENDAVCKVTGRTFNTFDSTEFKYDICSHLLARDVTDAKWNVIMRRNCSSGNNICSKQIEIKDKVSKYTLILFPSLNVNLDGYL